MFIIFRSDINGVKRVKSVNTKDEAADYCGKKNTANSTATHRYTTFGGSEQMVMERISSPSTPYFFYEEHAA